MRSGRVAPLGCLRSDHNFAHLAAAPLGLSLADVSCSGAKTDDMTAAPFHLNARGEAGIAAVVASAVAS